METLSPTEREVGTRINWYRTPLDKQTIRALNAKSDFKGFIQAFGHLGILAMTGASALWAAAHSVWWLLALAVFCHGTAAAFMINAVHELDHKSVFKTQKLNDFFAKVFAFIGWIHPEHFYNSHMRHHQFTLHPPDDLEVVLPIKILAKQFWQYGFVHARLWESIGHHLKNCVRLARGGFEGEWELKLYPADKPEIAAPVMRWAKTMLAGHALILIVSVACGVIASPVWFLVPVLVSLTPLYGSWLFFLCNNTQHIGLQDNVSDFRLSCRTFTLNPVARFLYWHMNYHIEHHMYAAVPCYNLKKLHDAIRHELPPSPNGLIAVWKEIAAIQKLQEQDSNYHHVASLPGDETIEAEPQPPPITTMWRRFPIPISRINTTENWLQLYFKDATSLAAAAAPSTVILRV